MSKRRKRERGCFLAMKDGAVWCEFHRSYHEHSIDWGKHIRECYGLENVYNRSQLNQVPMRSLLYDAFLCKCGIILLELVDD